MLLRPSETIIRQAIKSDPVQPLVELINHAYRIGEEGILVDTADRPFARVMQQDVEAFIDQQKLLVACMKNSKEEGSILGCVKMDRVEESGRQGTAAIGEWGCLAVSTNHQQQGLGRRLVEAAEETMRNQWKCKAAQLELLAPTNWKHSHKERLKEWYTRRMGYRLKVQRGGAAEDDYEASTSRLPSGSLLGGRFLLATDADFTTYYKEL